MPVLVKILVSFSIIILCSKLLKNLAIAIILGTGVLAVWSGHSLISSLSIAWARFYALDNFSLLMVILCVIWLSSQMQQTEIMKNLVENINNRLSQKASLAVLPAVIGLLPMPGGALFSAPLVDGCDTDGDLSSITKTRINYWFRHIWEYFWPLYPAVLLTVDITRLPIWKFMVLQFPIFLLMVFIGYWFILRKLPKKEKVSIQRNGSLIKFLSPILMVILVYALISLLFPSLEKISKYLPMLIGLVTAIIYLQILKPLTARQWKGILLSKKAPTMAILVASIRIYGAFIEARLPEGVLLMEKMSQELDLLGIPPLFLILFISFLSGITTGLGVGFVGASFPIMMVLLGQNPSQATFLSTVVLAYACGQIGQLNSPMHVCLVVTNQHFGTSLLQSLSSIFKPVVALLAGVIVYSSLLYLVF